MNKEKLLALGLTEEQVNSVLEGFKGYIPPERFNEVNEAKKSAEATIAERDKQLAELKKGVGDNEALKSQIEKLQEQNKAAKEKFDADLKALKINNAIDTALVGSKAKNLKAARALLDLEKISLDGDKVKGLDEQIKSLMSAEDTKFLFDGGNAKLPAGTKAGESNTGGSKPVNQMNYSELAAYMDAGGKL